MEKNISKVISINLKFNYSEANILIGGGTIHTDMLPKDIFPEDPLGNDDIEQIQLSMRIDKDALKHLQQREIV